ncbi:hypothetical protein R3P38DRAFT_3450810 [Favolaschia claudopus]|uniref:Uncharacterized protein n=1 Tax=Favolaschia claudopus TaxID=2862362 RepID=A0AAV9ZKW4_9AGAR
MTRAMGGYYLCGLADKHLLVKAPEFSSPSVHSPAIPPLLTTTTTRSSSSPVRKAAATLWNHTTTVDVSELRPPAINLSPADVQETSASGMEEEEEGNTAPVVARVDELDKIVSLLAFSALLHLIALQRSRRRVAIGLLWLSGAVFVLVGGGCVAHHVFNKVDNSPSSIYHPHLSLILDPDSDVSAATPPHRHLPCAPLPALPAPTPPFPAHPLPRLFFLSPSTTLAQHQHHGWPPPAPRPTVLHLTHHALTDCCGETVFVPLQEGHRHVVRRGCEYGAGGVPGVGGEWKVRHLGSNGGWGRRMKTGDGGWGHNEGVRLIRAHARAG